MAIPSKELFSRRGNSSDLLNEEYRSSHFTEGSIINTWDDFFKGSFGDPVGDPKKTSIYVKRRFPSLHPDNPYGFEVVIPYQFGFDDSKGNRWFAVLYDLGRNGDWRFLLFKPDRQTYLHYLMGEVSLLQLYKTTAEFYLSNPELGPELIKVSPADLTEEQLPLDDAYYGPNIIFDSRDYFFGHNTAPADQYKSLAEVGSFY